MTNYPTKKLGGVCDILYGFAFKAANFNEASKGLPVIRIGDVDKNATDKFFDGEYDEKYLVKRSDILLGLSGSFKVAQWQGGKALLNQRVATLRNFENEISEKFVFYQMPQLFLEFERRITQLSVKNILTKHLNNLDVLYPPLAIQKQIVERLDKIAEAQKLNDELIQKTDELYRSLLHNELNVKIKNQNAKSQFKIEKLGEICDIYQPQTITSNEILKEGPYKVFGANGVIGYYTKFNHENAEVLVTCRGATCGTLNMSEPKSWITGNAMVVRPKDEEIISKEFLFYSLENSNLKRTITGTGQPQITRNSLSPFQIILPSLKIQKQIVAKLSAVQSYKKELLEQKSKLKELFDSVLAKSFK